MNSITSLVGVFLSEFTEEDVTMIYKKRQ